jgi:para-nitrobenzyl esterase
MRKPRDAAAWTLAASLLLTPGCAPGPDPLPPGMARVSTGVLQGALDSGIVSFKGVPYAAPPVDSLRWRPPRPAPAWDSTLDATTYGALCMQRINPEDNGVGPGPASEDCLTLNVWAPAEPTGALPVLFWIHGGGYVNGSGTAALYDGTGLARQGAVVVTINYRLGRFGFFAHPALSAEAGEEALGNYGLMDQIAALQWVQDNIDAIGGDPDDVTIFGESAGGGSVTHLMISPMATGLFHKAIVQSGLGRERSAYLAVESPEGMASAESSGKAFMESLGVDSDDPADLRAVPADEVLGGGDPQLSDGGGPIVDGRVITGEVDLAFAAGEEAMVPLIIGYNSLEFPVADEENPFFRAIVTLDADMRGRAIERYGDVEEYRANILSDMLFVEPARNLARRHAENGQPTWLYRFSAISPSMRDVFRGAVHASERQYVFRTLETSPWPTGGNDEEVAETMSAYWAAFAATGDPNGEGRPAWPRYSMEGDTLLEFTDDGPVARPVPHGDRLDLITEYYEARSDSLHQSPNDPY